MNYTAAEYFAIAAALIACGMIFTVAIFSILDAYDDFKAAQWPLSAKVLPATPCQFPRPSHPALALAYTAGYYDAARAARNSMDIETFFYLAFDKAPSATPDSFAALTPKQISTRRGQQHKHHNKITAMQSRIASAA